MSEIIYRSQCTCPCHDPDKAILHFVACCEPDPPAPTQPATPARQLSAEQLRDAVWKNWERPISELDSGWLAGEIERRLLVLLAAPAVEPSVEAMRAAREFLDSDQGELCWVSDEHELLANLLTAFAATSELAARKQALEKAAEVAENCWQPRKDIADLIRSLSAPASQPSEGVK